MEANPVYYPQSPAQPQLQYVSVGTRCLALLIDGIILVIVGSIIFALLRSAPAVAGVIEGIIGIVYFVGLEATQGATLGKKVLGLRVVKTDGSPIGRTEAIIRNLLRIVDGLFVYLVGAILIWTSPLRQRLGDRLAHTVVIRRQS